MLRQSYNVDVGYIYRYLKLSVLWLHILFSPLMRGDRALCRAELFHSAQCTTNDIRRDIRVLVTRTEFLCVYVEASSGNGLMEMVVENYF